MKFIDEFRNADIARELSNKIRLTLERIGRPVSLMEVCGTHTMAIYRHGIKSILPSTLKLLSGPGCPVCVTPNRYLDYAIALSRQDGVIITTFGDMINVPGSSSTLVKERAAGADIRTVYSPLDALAIAQKIKLFFLPSVLKLHLRRLQEPLLRQSKEMFPTFLSVVRINASLLPCSCLLKIPNFT